jgi:hypothetical protein
LVNLLELFDDVRTCQYQINTKAALLVVVWPVITGQTSTNNAATTTLQGKTRGC